MSEETNPIRMEVFPNKTDLVISCSWGQNQIIEQLLESIKPVTPQGRYEVQIKRKRAKRSKNANAYMWTLCEEIAKLIGDGKENVYKKAVREVGVYADALVATGEPMAELVSTWSNNGIGWFAEAFEPEYVSSKKMKWVRLYRGSSTYDSKQMSRLVDYIVEEAHDLGIETDTPDEIARMKGLWGVT